MSRLSSLLTNHYFVYFWFQYGFQSGAVRISLTFLHFASFLLLSVTVMGLYLVVNFSSNA